MEEPIELEVALNLLLMANKFQPKTESVALVVALSRIVAKDIFAPINVPEFNRAAMDGYAVKAVLTVGATVEKPATFNVVDEIHAGGNHGELFGDDVAIRIMTGAKIPDGFDAVVKQEDTDFGDKTVNIFTEIKPFTNYGAIGEDVKKDSLLIPKNTRLTPIHLGMLASVGIFEIPVFSKVKVGLISTGDELAQMGAPLKNSEIYNSNQFILLGLLQQCGAEVKLMKQVGDEPLAIGEAIKSCLSKVDVVMTTGGVSVGKRDFLHTVMPKMGAKKLFWRVNIQPGTPVLASVYQEKIILSLSGNPFAALVNFELLAKPLLSHMMGQGSGYDKKRAKLTTNFLKIPKRRRFLRGFYEDGHVSLPTAAHASSVLSSMANCNCLIDIKAGTTGLACGDEVEVLMI